MEQKFKAKLEYFCILDRRTIHEDIFEKELTETICKTRAHFRNLKLERILDGE